MEVLTASPGTSSPVRLGLRAEGGLRPLVILSDAGETAEGDPLAPTRLQAVLALEIKGWQSRSTEDCPRDPRSDSIHFNVTAHPTALWTAQQIVDMSYPIRRSFAGLVPIF